MADLETFRAETRAWLEANCPPEVRGPRDGDEDYVWGGRNAVFKTPAHKLWLDRMAARGWTAPEWPREYGGGGLSREEAKVLAAEMRRLQAQLPLASFGVWMLGPALLAFGTEEQKKKYLPRCAAGDISAFALTEMEVGSDPARMKTSARLSEDGSHWILDGEKLWCTNGLKAKHLIVMARTPLPDKPNAITAFIVETAWPGVEIVTRCHFMGLRALYNGVIRFSGVKIPRENVVHGEGKGLKVALTTLNTGRLTLPAACVGLIRRCLDIALDWSRTRVQWGQAIGKHEAIAGKLADLAADAFATEAMVRYTSALVDVDKHADIRLEAAMAKLWGTEAGWRAADSTMQIKGGRGYETADSLRARGDKPDPVERLLRDCRINTIFEGSTEIMHLFIAREALDPHLRRGAAALDTRKASRERLGAAMKAGLFYASWYPARWIPSVPALPPDLDRELARGMRAVEKLSRKLARTLFHAMARNGPKLERRQLLLGRLVDAGSELFAMSVSVARAHALGDETSLRTARYICRRGRQRVETLFDDVGCAPDKEAYRLAKGMLDAPAQADAPKAS